jgi:hypothetical protein
LQSKKRLLRHALAAVPEERLVVMFFVVLHFLGRREVRAQKTA